MRQLLTLYREQYFVLNVRHFHEKLRAEHQITLSYTWVKTALQMAGLVAKETRRGTHRKARPRRPLPGMLLHTDASTIPEFRGWRGLRISSWSWMMPPARSTMPGWSPKSTQTCCCSCEVRLHRQPY